MAAPRRPAFQTNLKSLECFRAIIDLGSATSAAQHLRLTQPAVSRLLRLLEEQTGVELFHRSKGRLIPTDEALLIYKEVDIALQSVDRVSELARNIRNDNFGELRIVSPPSLAESILSRVISGFIAKLPNVQVSLASESVEVAKDLVALRAVDCGFIKLPAEHPGLECTSLISSPTVCAIPHRHRLAGQERIRVSDLRGEPLIVLGKGRNSRKAINDAFESAGVKMDVRIEAHTVGAACAFARDGTGIAITNAMLGLQYIDRRIVFRPLDVDIEHEYAFMSATGVPMTRITRRFLDYCADYFRQNGNQFRLG